MVCNLTIGRPRFADVEGEVRTLLAHCSDLRGELMRLADADAAAYLAVRDAYRLPRGTEAEQEARSDAIEAAMHGATEVPVDSARSAAAVLDLAVEAARITNPVALGDVAVATHLALGSTRGAADQARMNLSTMKDAAFVSQTGGQIDGLLTRADTAAQQALADIQTRVPAG